MEESKQKKAVSAKAEKSIRILVVDDNAILLRTVREMLGDRYIVDIAASSSQAFMTISKNRPDIILLDYEMPYVDGEEILKKLRASEERDIPVVFFTSSADREVVTKLVALNPDGYLLKPPNKQKMVAKIEKILTHPESDESNDAEDNAEQTDTLN